jgi:hypothetical protein
MYIEKYGNSCCVLLTLIKYSSLLEKPFFLLNLKLSQLINSSVIKLNLLFILSFFNV